MKGMVKNLAATAAVVAAALTLTGCPSAQSTKTASDGETAKIGILHSLSGTMAISEVSLRDVLMMGIEEINAAGGVMGKQIEPVIVDPASNWDLFAEKSKDLLGKEKVNAVFGCWTSVSRKAVLPVFEEYGGLLFYPVQYEGQECSPNIIYSGGTPNQQLIPGVEYLMSEDGGSCKKFYLLGSDYVFPRTANNILKNFLLSKGVPAANIIEEYTPVGHQDYQTIVSKINAFAASGDACVLNTINGDSNVPFYKEFANQGLTADKCPVMAFSVAEDELRAMDTEYLVGHLAAWNYFQSEDTPANKKFVADFKAYCAKNNLPGGANRVTDDPICWAYTDLYLWKAAVEKAQSFDVKDVVAALSEMEFDSPAGKVKMHKDNHHLAKYAVIGEILENGQFEVLSRTEELVIPEPFSEFSK
ncbi:MAG: urea ABC transporter substrate-binding protein [Rikenellaceae bacterium]